MSVEMVESMSPSEFLVTTKAAEWMETAPPFLSLSDIPSLRKGQPRCQSVVMPLALASALARVHRHRANDDNVKEGREGPKLPTVVAPFKLHFTRQWTHKNGKPQHIMK